MAAEIVDDIAVVVEGNTPPTTEITQTAGQHDVIAETRYHGVIIATGADDVVAGEVTDIILTKHTGAHLAQEEELRIDRVVLRAELEEGTHQRAIGQDDVVVGGLGGRRASHGFCADFRLQRGGIQLIVIIRDDEVVAVAGENVIVADAGVDDVIAAVINNEVVTTAGQDHIVGEGIFSSQDATLTVVEGIALLVENVTRLLVDVVAAEEAILLDGAYPKTMVLVDVGIEEVIHDHDVIAGAAVDQVAGKVVTIDDRASL